MDSEVSYTTLVVDDDNDIRSAIARILARCGCTVSEAASIEDAIEQLAEEKYDVIFSDVRFSEDQMSGEDLLDYTTREIPAIKVVMMSSVMNSNQQADLKDKGAACCLQKPFFQETCLEVLNNIHCVE